MWASEEGMLKAYLDDCRLKEQTHKEGLLTSLSLAAQPGHQGRKEGKSEKGRLGCRVLWETEPVTGSRGPGQKWPRRLALQRPSMSLGASRNLSALGRSVSALVHFSLAELAQVPI